MTKVFLIDTTQLLIISSRVILKTHSTVGMSSWRVRELLIARMSQCCSAIYPWQPFGLLLHYH